jgi:hypothetical protein
MSGTLTPMGTIPHTGETTYTILLKCYSSSYSGLAMWPLLPLDYVQEQRLRTFPGRELEPHAPAAIEGYCRESACGWGKKLAIVYGFGYDSRLLWIGIVNIHLAFQGCVIRIFRRAPFQGFKVSDADMDRTSPRIKEHHR